jgi:hypothetical protein
MLAQPVMMKAEQAIPGIARDHSNLRTLFIIVLTGEVARLMSTKWHEHEAEAECTEKPVRVPSIVPPTICVV